MDLEALKQTLASLDINPDEIEDKRYATAFRILFAIIEKQNEENKTLKVENQKLRDENNSSENERKQRNPRKDRESNSRKDKIEIHQTETCKVDRSILPEDAVSKGYRYATIRDIIVKPVSYTHLTLPTNRE